MGPDQERYLDEVPPGNTPLLFKHDIIPEGQLAHAGVFSPDMSQYYFTLSNIDLNQFTVMVIENRKGSWTAPERAFFNSTYLEHGVQFTLDGQWIYFSSTRPSETDENSFNWHIWRCKKLHNSWSEAEQVYLPDMANRTTSHPSFTHSGRMYFHSYNSDFSDMNLFMSDPIGHEYQQPRKIEFHNWDNSTLLTPFVAPDESYLLFTKKFDNNHHEIFISIRYDDLWQTPQALAPSINTNNLGNPFVTPDERYLFFATGHWPTDAPAHDWVIKWVNPQALVKILATNSPS